MVAPNAHVEYPPWLSVARLMALSGLCYWSRPLATVTSGWVGILILGSAFPKGVAGRTSSKVVLFIFIQFLRRD